VFCHHRLSKPIAAAGFQLRHMRPFQNEFKSVSGRFLNVYAAKRNGRASAREGPFSAQKIRDYRSEVFRGWDQSRERGHISIDVSIRKTAQNSSFYIAVKLG
jgi:hypothetical protein